MNMIDGLKCLEKKRVKLNVMDIITFDKKTMYSLDWIYTDNEGYLKCKEFKLSYSSVIQFFVDQLIEHVFLYLNHSLYRLMIRS